MLILASPILLFVAAIVLLKMGRPIFFRQTRVGHLGVPFQILKFRTMVSNAESLGGGYMPPELNLVPPLGAFLRKSSLDELPQLLNIARGEMSFVGPRPALVEQYERYTTEQARRTTVPQGVTGLAQVRFRNNAPWSVRILSDLEYVETVSPIVDIQIMLATVKRVIRSDGVIQDQVRSDVDDLSGPQNFEEGKN
jgi:lipopolysaccharide/colanic/teichoic acid biosynthesis glycosyltransferase